MVIKIIIFFFFQIMIKIRFFLQYGNICNMEIQCKKEQQWNCKKKSKIFSTLKIAFLYKLMYLFSFLLTGKFTHFQPASYSTSEWTMYIFLSCCLQDIYIYSAKVRWFWLQGLCENYRSCFFALVWLSPVHYGFGSFSTSTSPQPFLLVFSSHVAHTLCFYCIGSFIKPHLTPVVWAEVWPMVFLRFTHAVLL